MQIWFNSLQRLSISNIYQANNVKLNIYLLIKYGKDQIPVIRNSTKKHNPNTNNTSKSQT